MTGNHYKETLSDDLVIDGEFDMSHMDYWSNTGAKSTSTVYSGARSLEILMPVSHGSTISCNQVEKGTQSVAWRPVVPGETVFVSARIRVTAGAARIGLGYGDASNFQTSTQSSPSTTAVNTWQFITAQFVIPDGVHYVYIRCEKLATATANTSAFFDRVSMRKSPFTPVVGTHNPINSSNISTFMAAAAIGTAYIGDATITSAKIGNAEVGTLKIADKAVTAVETATWDSILTLPTSFSGNFSTYANGAQRAVTIPSGVATSGSVMRISVEGFVVGAVDTGVNSIPSGGGIYIVAEIRRNGVIIDQTPQYALSGTLIGIPILGRGQFSSATINITAGMFSFSMLDRPAVMSGTFTYSVHFRMVRTSVTYSPVSPSIQFHHLTVTVVNR